MANHKSKSLQEYVQAIHAENDRLTRITQEVTKDLEMQRMLDEHFLNGNLWIPLNQKFFSTRVFPTWGSVIGGDPVKLPEPPKEPEFEVNMMECLVGWKSWSLANGDLRSSSRNTLWNPMERHVAVCTREQHVTSHIEEPSPEYHCSCGIYAASNQSGITEYIDRDCLEDNAIGEVYGWGKYIRGESGWRAQYAYPKYFIIGQEAERHLPMLMEFRVPIFVMKPVEIFNPREDGYTIGNWAGEADRDSGAIEGTDPDEDS